jgi:ATP-dependent Clp protease adaptor protein ClpS
MDRNLSNPQSQENTSEKKSKEYFLILHNDDINTFDHVINCLIDICNHDYVQAEQCATLTHYKGKCDIKKGDKKSLLKMKNCLSKKGLIVSLE